MLSRRTFLGAAALAAPGRAAVECPLRQPVRWIVPNAPGGGFDNYSRLVEPFLERELDASIRIDNMPGAGGARGARALAEAPPDGSTIGILNVPGLLMASITGGDEPNPVNDFTVLGAIARSSYMWAASASSEIRSVDDLLAISRDRGLVFGVNSTNNTGFLASALALGMLGWHARFVAGYGGSTAKALAAIRGDVDLVPLAWDSLIPRTKAGELRPIVSIATDTTRIHPVFRGVPGMDGPEGLIARWAPESSPDIEALVRFTQAGRILAAPKRIRGDVAECLRSAVCRALHTSELAKTAAARNTFVQPECAKKTVARLQTVEADARRLAVLTPEAIRRVQT